MFIRGFCFGFFLFFVVVLVWFWFLVAFTFPGSQFNMLVCCFFFSRLLFQLNGHFKVLRVSFHLPYSLNDTNRDDSVLVFGCLVFFSSLSSVYLFVV